jgi:acetoin utilization deacetylase AcuC-like enzyme
LAALSVYSSPLCFLHDPKPKRGFAPLRLRAVEEALRKIDGLAWRDGPKASRDYLELLHTPEYLDLFLDPVPSGKDKKYDAETYAMSATSDAAMAAAGLVWQATQDVAQGRTRRAFCLASPGGHHAEADLANGFCFLAHAALAAVAAQKFLNKPKVAVLDFDAHHGNGTQSFFWNYEDRLYISLHEETGLSGFADETGAWNNVMNLPLPKGSDSSVFRRAIEEKALPKIAAFAPDMLFVSAGFDMLRGDPLAHQRLEIEDYAWLGRVLSRHGPLVAVLEGGYKLDSLGPAVAAFVKGLITE